MRPPPNLYFLDPPLVTVFILNRNVNSDGQQFHQYQQNERSPLNRLNSLNAKKLTTYDVRNPGPVLGQVRSYDVRNAGSVLGQVKYVAALIT